MPSCKKIHFIPHQLLDVITILSLSKYKKSTWLNYAFVWPSHRLITLSGTPLVIISYLIIPLGCLVLTLTYKITCRSNSCMQCTCMYPSRVLVIIIYRKCTSFGRVIRCAIVVKNSPLIPGVFFPPLLLRIIHCTPSNHTPENSLANYSVSSMPPTTAACRLI
jgi:hypothetical protein